MTKELIIETQKQLDKIKADFEGTIYIEGGTRFSPLVLSIAFEDARVIVRGESFVRLRESSHAELRESSHAELRESSHAVLWGSSHAVLRGSSHAVLRESSHAELWGSSHAVLWGSSHAVLRESSHAVLWGSSHAKLFGEAMVTARSAKEIVCAGYNVISIRKADQSKVNIVMNKDSYLKVVPDFEPTFKNYLKLYPVEVKGKKATMYKAVRKQDGRFLSDYNQTFEYFVGKKATEQCNPSTENSCTQGLHVSPKSWAYAFGMNWSDLAILEVEVPTDKIIVARDTDGKVRTSELKVIREVPKEEWHDFGA